LVLVLFPLLLSSLIGGTAQAAPNDVLGRYWFPDRDGQFEVVREGGRYFGKVIAYDIEGQLDENNKDNSLRGRPFVGINMLADFHYDADDNRWTGGSIYDAVSGTTYDCTMWFEDGKPHVIQARGFVGFAFLGRTESFERVLEEQEES
jgi:uncharacterized protein (DUF2147 family)